MCKYYYKEGKSKFSDFFERRVWQCKVITPVVLSPPAPPGTSEGVLWRRVRGEGRQQRCGEVQREADHWKQAGTLSDTISQQGTEFHGTWIIQGTLEGFIPPKTQRIYVYTMRIVCKNVQI